MDTPKNWPWRGVNLPIDILEYEPNIFYELNKKSINSIRIHVDFIKIMKNYNLEQDRAIIKVKDSIDKMLYEIKKYNMTSIIGIETFPYFKDECKERLKKEYWNSNFCINNMYEITDILSTYYSNIGDELTGYQFMSEPVYIENGESKLPEKWVDIQNNILNILRKNDKKHFFIYSSTLWALSDKFSNENLLADNKIIYNAHFFYPYTYTHQGIKENKFDWNYPGIHNFRVWDKEMLEDKLHAFIDFKNTHNVPVLIGSFSKVNWINDSNKWLEDTINLFENNNISWLYFIIGEKPWKGWDPRYIGNFKDKQVNKDINNETWLLLEKYFKKNKEGNKNDNINN
jgi:hypothetical protein